MIYRYLLLAFNILLTLSLSAQKEAPSLEKVGISGLKFRSIGPAKTSGRIADLAINTHNPDEYYVATASGGVWKTTNHGITYQPIFDNQGSYSIGCVEIDPQNEKVIWVGTGENNNQRSVAYGDGIYKSTDGGKSWNNVGLKESEHIGMIAIHPENSDVVYAAAYGPLWSAGGERGIYKTTNGGADWQKILDVSEHTGFNEIHMDPRDPDVLYATAHQRRRHVWTYVSGGPESAIYKSTDGGENWQELKSGLPSGDKGRIGMAISPADPDVLYAMIEGHGFYRSDDRGASWSKKSSEKSSGNYYVELVPHPTKVDVVYSMDTYMKVTRDGGSSFERVPRKAKHVDEHCLWIDPQNPAHMITGNDGGLYETYDNAQHWHFKPNLPVTQFYRVSVDSAKPFYNVYGGTQDNFSLGGPSQTINTNGIVNADWFVTNTGDGFESQVDPKNPNIVYAQAQYGWLVRFDKQSGERLGIKPTPPQGGEAYRWNWDAPLLISPHEHKTLYFAANKVFRSKDRGNNWEVISPDLTREIDRHELKVMGEIQSVDAISYDRSTSNYGNIVSFDESHLKVGLLLVGTDDGLIQISEDGGENWREIGEFPGVPERTYVNQASFSLYDEETIFAVFNNHKNGDFKPYILKSTDLGKSWTNISGDLPERGSVYTLRQDHKDKNLLFAGTEFGVFYSLNGGRNWRQIKAGLPTIAIRDMEIQRRENDLVLASFGRGFYILDDYSPLRELSDEIINKDAHVFDIPDGLVYLEASPLGYGADGFLGASYYSGDNPPVGATFTYYLKEAPQTLAQQRKEREKKKQESDEPVSYPTWEALKAEDLEEAPYLVFSISNASGKEVTRFTKSASAGLQRVTWNGRYSSVSDVSTEGAPQTEASDAQLAPPGKYSLRIYQSKDGKLSPITDSHEFQLKWLNNSTLELQDTAFLTEFQQKLEQARRDFSAISDYARKLQDELTELKAMARNTPGVGLETLDSLRAMEYELADIHYALFGNKTKEKRYKETPPSLSDRMSSTTWSYYSTSAPTGEQKKNLRIVKEEGARIQKQLKALHEAAEAMKEQLIAEGAPYPEGELPE